MIEPYTKPRDKFVALMVSLVKRHRFSSDNTLVLYKGLCETFAWVATGGHDRRLYKSILEELLDEVFETNYDYCPHCKGKCRGGFATVKLEKQ